MNYTKTFMLMAAMTALFMGIGYMLGGSGGLMIAFLVAGAMNFWSYWNSGNAVLSMHGAHEVDQNSAPEYYKIVADLAARAELPMPRVFIIDTDQPNAFATGRNPENAAVAASTGLLKALTAEEIAAVMAHELAHVEHRDTLIMTITATIAGAISMLANFAMFFGNNRNSPFGFIGVLVTMIVAPFAAMLVQMAISRTREYAADKRGAEICGNPHWLASALDKIARGARVIENEAAEHNPATAHMFIINPLADTARDNLFSTHPNTDNRIAALNQLAQDWAFSSSSLEVDEILEPQPRTFAPTPSKPWGSSREDRHEPQQQHKWGRQNSEGGSRGNFVADEQDEPRQKGPWG